MEGFEKRLRAQLQENSLLLKQVRELRNAQIVGGKSSSSDDDKNNNEGEEVDA